MTQVLKLVDSGITTMIATDSNYLALGCTDGAIRFYDFSLRLESWFEDIAGGSITSLSFSSENNPHDSKDAGHPGAKFWVPNFIIGTASALIYGELHDVYYITEFIKNQLVYFAKHISIKTFFSL